MQAGSIDDDDGTAMAVKAAAFFVHYIRSHNLICGFHAIAHTTHTSTTHTSTLKPGSNIVHTLY